LHYLDLLDSALAFVTFVRSFFEWKKGGFKNVGERINKRFARGSTSAQAGEKKCSGTPSVPKLLQLSGEKREFSQAKTSFNRRRYT
jgi:hypothetical protein